MSGKYFQQQKKPVNFNLFWHLGILTPSVSKSPMNNIKLNVAKPNDTEINPD